MWKHGNNNNNIFKKKSTVKIESQRKYEGRRVNGDNIPHELKALFALECRTRDTHSNKTGLMQRKLFGCVHCKPFKPAYQCRRRRQFSTRDYIPYLDWSHFIGNM